MADESKNNPNSQNIELGSKQAKDLVQSLSQVLKISGDYRDILKEAKKELNDSIKSFNKMQASLATINRSSINVKEIEGSLKKTRQEEYLSAKKLADLETKVRGDKKTAADNYLAQINKIARFEQAMLDADIAGDTKLANRYAYQIEQLQEKADKQANALSTEQLAYAQAVKSLELSQKSVNSQEKQLNIEKQLKKEIGLTGAVLGGLASKFGLASKYSEDLVEKARKLKEQGKQITFLDKAKVLGDVAKSGIKEFLSDPTAMLAAIPAIGGAISGLVSGLKSVLDYVIGVSSRATIFGRQLGMSTEEARKLNTEFSEYSNTQGSILATSQKLFESQIELGKSLGVNNVLSKSTLDTNIQLRDIAGLDEDTRARIAESATITGKESKSIVNSVLAQVVGLKQATGISFNYQQILSEASKLGGYLGLQFAKYPGQIAKALVTTKAMGLELKQLDSMADSFLDFESSISKEFEAQLLTGRDINLSKARELFLNNDLAGAAQEITSQVGSSADFLKMNRIQAESMAQAFGMSRDQMGDMLKKQELLSNIGAKDTDNAQKQYQLALKRYTTQSALADAVGEEAAQNMLNASNQEKIAGFMDKIKTAIADFIENSPLIPMIDKAIGWLSEKGNISKVVSMVKDTFATLFDIVGTIAGGVMRMLNYLPGVNIDEGLIDTVEQGGASIRAMNIGSMAGTTTNSALNNEKSSNTQSYQGGQSSSKDQTPQKPLIQVNNLVQPIYDSYRYNTNVQTGNLKNQPGVLSPGK